MDKFKKVLLNILLFLLSFSVFSILMMPYDLVAEYFISRIAKKIGIPLSWREVDSNPFVTRLGGVTIGTGMGNVVIDRIVIRHNPISFLIRREIRVKISSKAVNGSIIKRKGELYLDSTVNFGEFARSIKGVVKIDGKVSGRFGSAVFTSRELLLKMPIGDISLKKVQGKARLRKNLIRVVKLTSQGPEKLNARGNIALNLRSIEKSRINFSGRLVFMGKVIKFRVFGTLLQPRVKIKGRGV